MACSHYAQGLNDESEIEESEKHHIQLFEPGEDATESFELAEEPFAHCALCTGMVIHPRVEPVGLLRDDEEVVTPGRLELPTNSLGNCCSIHLSYGAT